LSTNNFSTPRLAGVFEGIIARKEEAGEVIAGGLGDLETYAKQLMMIGENEFADVEDERLSFEAFSLAHNVLLKSNAAMKKQLSQEIKEAEARGDVEAVSRLMTQFQAIIKSEV